MLRRDIWNMRWLVLALLLVPGMAQAQIDFKPASSSSGTSASLGAELAPAIAAADWTCGAGWDCSVAGTLNKNADGVGTAAPNPAITIVAGTTYKVVLTLGAVSVASGATYTLGGITGTPLTAATTYTDYVTAATTGSLIITPTPTGTRFTVTGVSVKALGTAGDFSVGGNLAVLGTSTIRGPVLLANGTAAAPILSAIGDPDTGIYFGAIANYVAFSGGGGLRAVLGQGGFQTYGIPSKLCSSAGTNCATLAQESADVVQIGVDAATAPATTIKGSDSTGANISGGSLTLAGGNGTAGNATGGQLILQGGALAGTGEPGAVAIADGGTKPTCAVGIRGSIWYDAGGAGVADTFEVCRKDAANAYAWVTLF